MRIPRVIHRIWLGGPTTPDVAEYGWRWKQLHSGWQVRTWRDWDMPALVNQDRYDQAAHPAEKSDIARLEIVHRYGGVYVDTDLDPRRPLDDLLEEVECFVSMEDERWMSNVIIGSVPSHPFLAHLIDGLSGPVDPDLPINERTGPKYVTSRFGQWLDRHPDGGGVTVFPPALFLPYAFSQPERAGEDFPDAYAVHRWHGSWVQNSPEAEAPETSVTVPSATIAQ